VACRWLPFFISSHDFSRLIIINDNIYGSSNGFSRQEAISMIVEQFDISRKSAARQLSLHVLPKMTANGMTLTRSECKDGDGEGHTDDWIGEQSILRTSSDNSSDEDEQQPQQQPLYHEYPDTAAQQHQQQKQPIRSIVISGVTSRHGRALFEYFCNHGHNVAGCGVLSRDIQSLKIQFPEAKLHVVDVRDTEAVAKWSSELDACGMDIDLVIACAEVCPQMTYRSPVWELTSYDFDRTMDANVKGIYTMQRHFIPRLIEKSNSTAASGGVRKERVFVAMSASFGGRLDPSLAAHCASTCAVVGLMQCVAMSIPEPLSAITFDPTVGEGSVQNDKGEDESQWVNIAAPMLLRIDRGSNGKSMSISS
jgi:NAD(P)-dependent dehydrogenase (short-subunit alcohol dehydrogenase family)